MKMCASDRFVNKFIDEYMHDGFASLPRNDIDILILHLLIKYGELEPGNWNKPDYEQLAIELKASEQEIRNIMSELSLSNVSNSKFSFY
ncbi:MAG TPA: hypothetical protein PK358_17780, partial [Spirochaetota bacterium]|nr:hypothetical protein [Spirochaetota bacterium]